MASRLIVIRQRLAAALDAAFAAFTGEVSPVLDERVGPFLEEEADFDFAALQRALARMVMKSRDRLVAADEAHIDELTGDVATRLERDRRVQAVRDKLIEIRGVLTGLFGAERTRQIVAVDGATAEQPELLWRQGEHTVSRLRDPELPLPAATTRAVNLDPSRWADELEPEVTALRLAIDAVAVDVQEAAVTVEVKKAAMAEHDRLMSACGRILSGFCLLADRPDLARQVRVTPPHRRRAASPRPESVSQEVRALPPTQEQNAGKMPALPATAGETPALPADAHPDPLVPVERAQLPPGNPEYGLAHSGTTGTSSLGRSKQPTRSPVSRTSLHSKPPPRQPGLRRDPSG